MAAALDPRFTARGFQWRYLLLLPVATAVVHLIVTFMAMNDTRGSAFALLAGTLPLNTMTLLPPIAPGQQPLPFLSTDARYSICRFSTVKGPMSVSAVLPDLGWSIGIYNPDGSTAYFATAPAGRPTQIALKIVPGDDRFLGVPPNLPGKAAIPDVPQLIVSAQKGLIVVRAPDKGAPYRQNSEAILSKAACVAQTF
jgi:hypothetical protein